ncbi:MAG: hypothetical protein BJ554DRAFT_1091, partial [Olpidium bornovanus]
FFFFFLAQKTCQWVTSEIISTTHLDDRVRLVEKFIRVALVKAEEARRSFPFPSRNFRNWKNIREAMREASDSLGYNPDADALERAAARARRSAAAASSDPLQLLMEDDGDFARHHSHHQHPFPAAPGPGGGGGGGRDSQGSPAAAADHWHFPSSTSAQPPPPPSSSTLGCIPFLGLYLSDLVFNAELPGHIDPVPDSGGGDRPQRFPGDAPRARAAASSSSSSGFGAGVGDGEDGNRRAAGPASHFPGDKLPPQRLVNFHKYRTIGNFF